MSEAPAYTKILTRRDDSSQSDGKKPSDVPTKNRIRHTRSTRPTMTPERSHFFACGVFERFSVAVVFNSVTLIREIGDEKAENSYNTKLERCYIMSFA